MEKLMAEQTEKMKVKLKALKLVRMKEYNWGRLTEIM